MSFQDERTDRFVEPVALPTDLYDRIERRLRRSEFDTVDGYATYVLEETIARVEEDTDDSVAEVDEAEVEARLQSLGYLD